MGDGHIDIVAVNDLTNAATLAHLLKYDSILGNLKADISAAGDKIKVNQDEFQVLSIKDPGQLPWKDLGVDVVFESTAPPDGERHAGADAVRAVWQDLFGGTPGARFTEEDRFVAGDRGVLCWRFDWDGDEPGHVRGVDVLRFRDGKVAEKRSYVKG